jgi:aryl-alcohol dehydrogenase-like predicted oxidoreductase
MHEQGFFVLETLDHGAATHSATVSQIALAWIMAQLGIASAIASTTSVEQVHELLSVVEVSLREDEIQALNRASASK